GLRHQLSLRTSLARRAEHGICSERYLAIQVNLDQTAYRLWGELPGEAGGIVSSALSTRGEGFPPLPDGSRGTLGQRQADALTSICTDSLTGGSTEGENGGGSQPLLVITLEGSHLSSDGEPGESGLSVLSGPRVGPETLDVLLCTGKVEINLVTSEGRLLGVGEAFSYLSPRLRRHVLARDGGCSVDGCESRYRLEAHHIITRREGGSHHPENQATVCWFHHHIVIHGLGYRIDPDSLPHRRRFLKPDRPPGPDPP
ncbi:MAG TPA: HNH endonuclease signature motif containing protein, partial [Acidimicrobiia bacterium]|nr:HNH endonuclease signature motif containing protein [Acidimicrobiia bacterium]